VKRPSSWPDTPFWPISLEKINKRGAKKVENQPSSNFLFKIQYDFDIIKEVLLSCFGIKIGPVWGVVACFVETQCQNLNWISVQSTGVVLLAPNFMNHLVISFKHDL